nr:MAG TPA: Protein of unknown function (DUF2631) [Caudoviricetes sp.]
MGAAPFSRLWPSACWGPHPYVGKVFQIHARNAIQ